MKNLTIPALSVLFFACNTCAHVPPAAPPSICTPDPPTLFGTLPAAPCANDALGRRHCFYAHGMYGKDGATDTLCNFVLRRDTCTAPFELMWGGCEPIQEPSL